MEPKSESMPSLSRSPTQSSNRHALSSPAERALRPTSPARRPISCRSRPRQEKTLQKEEQLPGPTKKPVLRHSTAALTEGRNGDHGRLRDSILFPPSRQRPEIHDR